MASSPSSSGTSSSDTFDFSRLATGVSYDGGAGNDYITGSRGDDTIRGGSGADRIQGGAGSDTYVFVAGDLTGALSNGVDHIVDFQGAGTNTASGFQDKLALYGYSADAYLRFHHYAADRVASGTNADGSTKYILQTNLKMQYYEVIDPADTARNGFILVQMQDGTSQLDVSKGSGDVVFLPDAITGTASGDVTEAGRNEAGSANTGGTLAATTFDQGTGFKAAPAEALAGAYGDFSFAGDGTWSFALDDTRAATQALGAGQTQTLTVQTLAGTTQTLTVTVHGTNDAATITGQAAGAVQEDKTLTAKGALAVSDVDAGEAQFVARGAQDPVKGAYGSLTIDAAGAWTYTLDNASAAVQALSASDTRTDTLTVTSRDGTTQAITVTVQGTNEAAKLIAPIELSDVAAGKGGFKIKGEATQDLAGLSVSGAGDVNGDGVTDFLVGARYNDSNGLGDNGAAYVVFGQKDLASTGGINLTDVAAGKGGFRIKGEASNDSAGISVSGAGDVNGDGVADLIVGAYNNGSNGQTYNGAAYVVFGQKGLASTGGIDLADVAAGKGGFKIKGEATGDSTGYVVSEAGDVNGDGVADILVGAPYADSNGQSNNGAAYVVLGQHDWLVG
ncbi:VCBS domain-containing protein [Methylorubrum extorquens]